jgi:hypothetical protein
MSNIIYWRVTGNVEGGAHKIIFILCIKVHIFEESYVLFGVKSTAAQFESNTEDILQTFWRTKN